MAPTKVPAGQAAFTLAVNGTGFVASTQLQLGGNAVPSTYMSSTQLIANVPSKSVSDGALLAVVASNGTTTSSSGTAAVQLEVDNPVPQISGFQPTSLVAASGSSTLSVAGTGFVPSTVIEVNGSARPTALVSATQVNFTITDADVATGGSLSLMAHNPAPAGGDSAAASVPVLFPVPGGITLSPSSVLAGTKTSTLMTVTGTNFVNGSVAQVNGSARPTTVVSSTQLTFSLTSADQAAVGTASVTVTNPQPGGGTSTAATLTLAAPAPTAAITSLSPTSLLLNTPGLLFVSGTAFTTNSVVNWNGKALATTYNPATTNYGGYPAYLAAKVTADLLAATGTASITVTDAGAVGPSNALSVQIVKPPVPMVSSITPSSTALNQPVTMTVTGTGFTPTSVVQLDGVAMSTTYTDMTKLSANVPASSVSLPGSHSLTVSTPAPGGGVSGSVPFTAFIALPNNAMALNPVNGLLYVSVPSSAGASYGNSVVSVDPATGALGTPIKVGSEPDKLAISSDGTTLWVGLDGASAVRKVDLTTGTPGLQFSFGGNSGVYAYPPIAHAIAVLPGVPNSIAVSYQGNPYTYEDNLTIFDNGVPRSKSIQLSTISSLPGIFASPTKPEIYATSYQSGYQILQYDSSGLSNLGGNSGTSVISGVYASAVQVDNGRAYLNSGQVLDAETGTLIGTFYTSGTTAAAGPIVSDSSLGKNFILTGTQGIYNYNQNTTPSLTLQAFNESDQTIIPSASIAVSGALTGTRYGAGNSTATELNGPNNIDTLVRWGSNGLAFRAANGIFSFRSNTVRDLSSTNADLQVGITSPASATTGAQFTITATVTNSGPSSASSVALTETLPSNAIVISSTASQGTCVAGTVVSCDLGSLANGGTATVTVVLQGTNNGDAALSATITASENDPQSTNNTAGSKTTLSGGAVAPAPAVTSIAPNAAIAGSQDVALNVVGTGFTAGSTVNWAGTALPTTFVDSTQLTATVPAASLANMGWAPVTVSTAAPGGGTSAAAAFSIVKTINLSANHLAMEPYTGRLYATVSSAATETTGNSLVVIDPLAASLGTPVSVGSQPGKMAFSDDGNVMYIALTGASSVGHFSLQANTLDFSFPVGVLPQSFASSTATVPDLAVAPGTENTLAIELDGNGENAVYDVNPTTKTATTRTSQYGQNATGLYSGSSLQFLNSSTLITAESGSATGSVYELTLASTGLTGTYNVEYTLNNFGSFHMLGDIGYADAGGIADFSAQPPVPSGIFLLPTTGSSYYGYSGSLTAPDPSLGRSFFTLSPVTSTSSSSSSTSVAMLAFDQKTYLQADALSFPYTPRASTGNNSNPVPTNVDFVRWGQDGLAALLSDGQVILLRGAFVIPQLLLSNGAASLTSVSQATLAHGSGNAVLSVVGNGFVPGVGVFWNGAYRTTTYVDSGHLSVKIPASDLTSAGTALITATNPNATASNALTETIN